MFHRKSSEKRQEWQERGFQLIFIEFRYRFPVKLDENSQKNQLEIWRKPTGGPVVLPDLLWKIIYLRLISSSYSENLEKFDENLANNNWKSGEIRSQSSNFSPDFQNSIR